MDVKIYQINMDRDTKGVAFIGYVALPRFQDTLDINSSIYDKVYDAPVEAKTLEDIYRIFNIEHPEDYRGRSLSVSDIVEIPEGSDIEPGFYFCDTIGFTKVEFDPEQTQVRDTGPKTIRVVLIEPNKLAQITDIDASLAGMQKVVGGDIEAFYPFEEQVCIVCNEEGKINGMKLNRAVYAEPEQVDVTYGELCRQFREAEDKGEHMQGYIVFTEDSFDKPYSEFSRTYAVSSNNKAFQSGMGGYSIYGSCLDGTDPCVRLEGYMAAEKGGETGWKIERCYTKEGEREMIDIIAGPCFICDCSGESFGSLSADQQARYKELFKRPEHFFRTMDGIKAVPYTPEKNHER